MVEYDEIIQLVYYLHKPLDKNASQLWPVIFDAEMSGFQTVRPGHTQAQAQIGDNVFSLQVQASRIDLIANGKPNNADVTPPSIKDFDACLGLCKLAIEKIARNAYISRTAAVFQGTSRFKSRDESARHIVDLVPGLPTKPDGYDYQYQIVVPRPSRVVETRRIVQIFRISNVGLQIIQTPTQILQARDANLFATHAYVDVSAEGVEILDAERATASMFECIDYARQVFKGGYNELV